MRTADSDKAEKVVALLRNNGSLYDIARAVESPVTRFTDSSVLSETSLSIRENVDRTLGTRGIEPTEIRTRRPSDLESASSWSESDKVNSSPKITFNPYARITLENLCDVPLFEVPAKPWTEVTDDSDLVSHLVSLYFTWDHPSAQFLDQGLFLRDMRTGSLESEFCSPVLVNSMLSMACV